MMRKKQEKFKIWFKRMLFVAYILLFCIIAGEITVRIFFDRLTNYNMEMWRYAAKLKQPLENEKLPFHHYPNREGGFYGVHIKTNSLGFRDGEYPLEKTPDKERILFVGDSFTLGWGVAFDELYSKKLEKRLNETGNKYEVINTGIGNYNSTMEVELFKLKGLPLKPDIVILMYFINDVEPVPEIKTSLGYHAIKHSYFFSFLFDRFVKVRSLMLKNYSWCDYYAGLYSEENASNLNKNKASLEELIHICKTKDISLYIVNIPEMHDFENYQFTYATDYIRSVAEEGEVPFMDLLPTLKKHAPETMWVSPEDPHANGKANAIIAEVIYDKLMMDRSSNDH
ncbi:MAG: SGNH/GDSL hydrolase family protein [Phycisphaerae bacterium]|nr:SGNH/GDSL hydrolase family protein [Phycisphaerae bacterium]